MSGIALSRRQVLAAAAAAALARTRFAFAQSAEARAAIRAYDISVLEFNRNFDGLYDVMHPDAQAFIARQVITGWYMDFLDGVVAEPLTVTGVRIIPWVWPVTGVLYPQTAEVSFIQPFVRNGVRTEQPEVIRLVDPGDGGGYRWFFGRTRAFVDQQIARYGAIAGAGEYRLTLLGVLDGFNVSRARALNNHRRVVGDASFFGEPGDRGFMWDNGSLVSLDHLTNQLGWINYAHDINDSNVIVGGSAPFEGAFTPYRITGNHYDELVRLPNRISASVEGISESGMMVGWSGSYFIGDQPTIPARAVVWTGGTIGTLPDLGATTSLAYAVNSHSNVAGVADWGSGRQAVIWTAGGLEPLPTFAGGQISATVTGMNDSNIVVGYSRLVENLPGGRPWVWVPGSAELTALPTPPDVQNVYELAINEAGSIVGTGWRANGSSVGLLWRDGNVYNLTDLLDSSGEWRVSAAGDINDQEDICGQVEAIGDVRSRVAALFTPRPV